MNIHSHILGKRAAGVFALSVALALAGCGGGGGNPGTTSGNSGGSGTGGTTTPASPTVSVAFANSSGQATNSLTGATQLTAKATVRDAAGKAVPNALVSFATDNSLAVFSPSAGTALTDANGVASVAMRAASLAAGGAGTVTVTTSVNGTNITAKGNFSVGATTLTFGTLGANPASIPAYGSTVLSVDLLAGNAKYTDQQVNVDFSSACVSAGKASLSTVVATNNGTAQTVYRDQGCGNNDTITVSAAGVATPATTQLTIAAPAAASVQFEQATPSNQSIVIQGQGGNGRTETASLKFKVMDIFNHPLAGAAVDFAASTSAVHVNKATDTTDQNGEVITTVNSGSTATSFRVKASLHNNTNVSTWSDSIVVTTGLPVQRAFSLSAEKYNLDGSLESTPTTPATHLQAMIADQFGNPVPDGTPVVFQTNMGSVGSASQGGCITTNGGCSVDFRVQNPRVATPGVPATPCNANPLTPDSTRPGVATVCASTTDGVNTVFGKIALFFGGNHATHVYMDNGNTPLPVNVSPDNGTDLGTLTASGSRSVMLQLNDSLDNPLPAGTTVAIANAVNVTVTAPTPATVPIIGTHSASGDDVTGANVSGRQGSTHSFTASPPSGCTKPLDASFNVVTTTPTGAVTTIPFKLAFSCP